jgi:hypothetical protein
MCLREMVTDFRNPPMILADFLKQFTKTVPEFAGRLLDCCGVGGNGRCGQDLPRAITTVCWTVLALVAQHARTCRRQRRSSDDDDTALLPLHEVELPEISSSRAEGQRVASPVSRPKAGYNHRLRNHGRTSKRRY